MSEAIENSNEGKEELSRIIKEGNQYKDGKGRKAGNFVKDIWEKDRESFFKDQRNNGEFSTCFIHDSNASICSHLPDGLMLKGNQLLH